MIISGLGKKYEEVEGLVFTLCGSSHLFEPWLNCARQFLGNYEGNVDNARMEKFLDHLFEFQEDWEENDQFEAEMVVFGIIDGRRTACQLLNDGGREITDINSHLSTAMAGINDPHSQGGFQANRHLIRFLRGELTHDDYMRITTEGITIAGLYNPATGCYLETCAFGKTVEGVFKCLVKEKRRHLMKHLALHYNVIEEEGHLQNCLIFVTIGLPYTAEGEDTFRRVVMLPFDADAIRIVGINILGVSLIKGVTIRLVRYTNSMYAQISYNDLHLVRREDWDDEFERANWYADFEREYTFMFDDKTKFRMIAHLPSLKCVVHSLVTYGGFEF